MKTSQSLNVTEAVKNWTDGTYANNGFLLWAIDENTVGYLATIGCWGGGGHVYREFFLDVTYTNKPVEPKLKIVEPNTTSNNECILPYLDENLPPDQIYPVMPQVTCKAVFDGLSSLISNPVDVNWQYIVEFDYKWRDIITGVTSTITSLDTIKGTTQISGSDTTAWLVNFADKFLGGTVTIIAKANVNGTVYADTLLNVYEIRGTNPKQNIVRDFIAYQNPGLMYELWAIFYYESDRKFAQFEGVNTNLLGYPLFGPPTGYGICQLDPVTDGRETAELWNWEVNVNSGIDRFLNKKTKFLDNNKYQNQIINGKDYYLEDHKWEWKDRTVGPLAPTPFTNRELMIDWMQLYNGGHYFYWVPIDKLVHNGPGHWEIHYNKIKKNMSIGVGEIYYNKSEQFRQGIFPSPSIWNNYLQGCQ